MVKCPYLCIECAVTHDYEGLNTTERKGGGALVKPKCRGMVSRAELSTQLSRVGYTAEQSWVHSRAEQS